MTTLTSAEGTLKQQPMEDWKTSGAATPWQILTSSNAAFVAAPDIGTAPLVLMFSPVAIEIERLNVQEPKLLDRQQLREQLTLFSGDQDPLQSAVLNVISYSPEPDEPSEHDVGPELGYRFPR